MPGKVRLTPAARLVRGTLCAALAIFLAGSSHAVAGGTVPTPALLLAFPLSALACVILAGRQLSLPRVALGVGISQVVFHFLFNLFGALPSTVVIHAGHQHDGIHALPLSLMTSGTGSPLGGMEVGMIASHLVAGLVTMALVRHGERLWWSLMGVLQAAVTTILCLVRLYPVSAGSRRGFIEYAPYGLHELLQCDTRLRLRGPPTQQLSFS
jgi:hypothetical protein